MEVCHREVISSKLCKWCGFEFLHHTLTLLNGELYELLGTTNCQLRRACSFPFATNLSLRVPSEGSKWALVAGESVAGMVQRSGRSQGKSCPVSVQLVSCPGIGSPDVDRGPYHLSKRDTTHFSPKCWLGPLRNGPSGNTAFSGTSMYPSSRACPRLPVCPDDSVSLCVCEVLLALPADVWGHLLC